MLLMSFQLSEPIDGRDNERRRLTPILTTLLFYAEQQSDSLFDFIDSAHLFWIIKYKMPRKQLYSKDHLGGLLSIYENAGYVREEKEDH